MRKVSILLVWLILVSSCSPASSPPEPASAPTETATFLPTETPTRAPTAMATVIPTATLSPDLNTYECAENVSKTDCDFVKEGVRLARYFFVNNFHSDISGGVKFTIVNDPNDVSRGEGGSAGAFHVPTNGEPFVWINVGHPLWSEYSSAQYQHKNLGLVIHEFTHVWQWQSGCLSDRLNSPALPTGFLNQGYAEYTGRIAAEFGLTDSRLSDEVALGFWQASEWRENAWFDNTDVNVVVVRHLVEDYGLMAYAQYCRSVGEGAQPNDAFQSAYGISIMEFRSGIKDEILGGLKDCTVATCGAGVDVYSGKYKLGNLLDPTKSTPNLVVKFLDQNNEPVVLTHVEMHKQNIGSTGDYAQPFIVPGVFSQAMLPGRYGFTFCEPGYPTDQSSFTCKSPHETEWFDVFEDQVTEITFQLQPPTENPNLSSPNLIATFRDKNGNPISDLGVEVCSYGLPVRICDSGGLTDLHGVYSDSLRSGKYLLRTFMIGTEWPIEFFDIVVNESAVTEVSFQFPQPNLVVKLTDANGGPVPEHELTLCKIVNGVGECYASSQLGAAQGRKGITNMEGIFETLVEPGEYYILTCRIACHLNPPDYKIEDVVVTSETEITIVEFQLFQ